MSADQHQNPTSFFRRHSKDLLAPEPLAIGPWSANQIGGYAVCGVLARAIERHADLAAFLPVRLTVDLCAPVAADIVHTQAHELLRSPRLQLIDATVGRDDAVTARARAVFAKPTQEPPGQMWRRTDDLPPDPPDCPDTPGPPLFISGTGTWTDNFAQHQNASRKTVWQRFPPLVDGEEMSPFVRAAVMAETTSLVCHWGSAGAGFINIDTTLALTRLPDGIGLGLRADDQRSQNGISIGTATMFDRHGHLGTCTVTAIANARRQVDFTHR